MNSRIPMLSVRWVFLRDGELVHRLVGEGVYLGFRMPEAEAVTLANKCRAMGAHVYLKDPHGRRVELDPVANTNTRRKL